MTSIRLALDIVPLDSEADGLRALACPISGETLALHQPDEASPDRLVATCPGCQGWFLIDLTEAIMIRLPDRRAVRDARSASTGGRKGDVPNDIQLGT